MRNVQTHKHTESQLNVVCWIPIGKKCDHHCTTAHSTIGDKRNTKQRPSREWNGEFVNKCAMRAMLLDTTSYIPPISKQKWIACAKCYVINLKWIINNELINKDCTQRSKTNRKFTVTDYFSLRAWFHLGNDLNEMENIWIESNPKIV